jgi:hypothetical protein
VDFTHYQLIRNGISMLVGKLKSIDTMPYTLFHASQVFEEDRREVWCIVERQRFFSLCTTRNKYENIKEQ